MSINFELIQGARAPEVSATGLVVDREQRGLVGDIISRFEKRGLVLLQCTWSWCNDGLTTVFRYKLAAIKLVTPSKEHLEKHYEDLSDKPFFKGLVTCEKLVRPVGNAHS